VSLDAIPLTPSAKIDREALPPPGRERPALANAYAPPSTPLEVRLCELWADVLRVDGIGTTDPFVELGGDSLLASALVARALRAFAVEVPLAALLGAGTIRDMAMLILAHQVTALASAQRTQVEQLLSD
jgi:acyl carrier protein